MVNYVEKTRKRVKEADVNDLFIHRWSPRAMTGKVLNDDVLNTLFEAARWAPSSMNNQPWRFLVSKRNDKHWDTYFDLLMEGNKVWCKDASHLIVVVSKKTLENCSEYPSHSFEAGSAWQNLALQASLINVVVHGIGGFDYEKAREKLNIPEDYKVEMMIAVGEYNKNLSDEKQEKISGRKSLSEIIINGSF